jgi:hypothetical protein
MYISSHYDGRFSPGSTFFNFPIGKDYGEENWKGTTGLLLSFHKLFAIFLINIYIYIYMMTTYKIMGFVRGSFRSVLLPLSQSYVEHDLRKNKIVIPFFY